METNIQAQQGSSLPIELLRELRHIKNQFTREVLPGIKRHRHFASKSQQRRERAAKSCTLAKNRTFRIKFSPFAMTLGYGLTDNVRPQTQTQPQRFTASYIPTPAILPNQLMSVFIIAAIQSDPLLYVLQKIKNKPAYGFPGGGIETKETIIQAADREFMEESRGKEALLGVDISQYNPVCIGKFILNRATNGEQAAVVVVELPEKEKANIIPGGGDQEGEVVEEICFKNLDELCEMAGGRTILPNSKNAIDLYLHHLVS